MARSEMSKQEATKVMREADEVAWDMYLEPRNRSEALKTLEGGHAAHKLAWQLYFLNPDPREVSRVREEMKLLGVGGPSRSRMGSLNGSSIGDGTWTRAGASCR